MSVLKVDAFFFDGLEVHRELLKRQIRLKDTGPHPENLPSNFIIHTLNFLSGGEVAIPGQVK